MPNIGYNATTPAPTSPPYVRTDQNNTMAGASTLGWPGSIIQSIINGFLRIASGNALIDVRNDSGTNISWGPSFLSVGVAGVSISGAGNSFKTTAAVPTGLNGVAAVGMAAAIAAPTAPSAAYVQAEAAAMKTAVDAMRAALTNIGITA